MPANRSDYIAHLDLIKGVPMPANCRKPRKDRSNDIGWILTLMRPATCFDLILACLGLILITIAFVV